jgi:hypothetical protein
VTESSAAPTIPPAWPARLDGTSRRFPSVDAALRFLDRNLDVPIRLPSRLPEGGYQLDDNVVFLFTGDGQRGAQFNLIFDDGKRLTLQYGVSRLDGCAPEHSAPVFIAGQPGRLRSIEDGSWSELIWPATLAHPTGVYGLAGPFSPEEMLALARSMPRLRSRPRLDVGC